MRTRVWVNDPCTLGWMLWIWLSWKQKQLDYAERTQESKGCQVSPPSLLSAQIWKSVVCKIEKFLGIIQTKSHFPIISGLKLELWIQPSPKLSCGLDEMPWIWIHWLPFWCGDPSQISSITLLQVWLKHPASNRSSSIFLLAKWLQVLAWAKKHEHCWQHLSASTLGPFVSVVLSLSET